jgi:intracellular septation protein
MYWIFGAFEELLPLIAFFVVEAMVGFISGVIALCVTLVALLAIAVLLKRKLPRFAVVSSLAVLGFALLTIVTDNPAFFQFSDTAIEGVLAFVLLYSWWHKKPILKPLFERVFAITDEAWLILTWRWGMCLLLVAMTNELVRLLYSTEIWTVFKLYSTIGILLFGCYQFTVSARYRLPKESNYLGLRSKS